MKRFLHTNLFMFLLFSMITQGFNQAVIVGTEDGANMEHTYPSPFATHFKSHKAQYLYTALELQTAGITAGLINQISWNVLDLPLTPSICAGFAIKLLSTETASLSATNWETDATLVWGPSDYAPIPGDNTFELTTPFEWNGISNIIVEVCSGTTDALASGNAIIAWSGPFVNNVSHSYADDATDAICDYTGETELITETGGSLYRPVIAFGSTPLTCDELWDGYAVNVATTTICPLQEIHVNITPFANPLITYSWYQSEDGENWDLISDETNSDIILAPASTTWYRSGAKCPYTDIINFSTPVLITTSTGIDCACTPLTNIGSAFGDFISNVTIEDIDNTSEQLESPYYFKYTENTTSLFTGNTYPLQVSVGSRLTQNTIAAWIDFNADGVFSTEEKIGEAINLNAFEVATLNCFIPTTATIGETILRIREVFDASEINPCAAYDYGESEDYVITIISTPEAVADFSYSGQPTVNFTDLSVGLITNWEWDFNDGFTATEQNPAHTFLTNGSYNVCLTASNVVSSNTICKEITIDSYIPVTANFSFTGDPDVSFTDLSTGEPTTYIWDFGDGVIVEEINPVHTYLMNNIYSVCLTVMNDFSENTFCQDIIIENNIPIIAAFDFSGDPEVMFNDLSTGEINSWDWDFNDGYFSEEQNPTHLFENNGIYNVCLTVEGPIGSNTVCQEVNIDGHPSPVALFDFTGDPIITFSDLSVNAPSAWSWNFGDGNFSTEQNPIHTYLTNGDYEVCLTASNINGENTYCDFIAINGNTITPVANFEFTGDPIVTFTDLSSNIPDNWYWNFGDDNFSTEQNPVHNFTSNGSFNVCLTASNVAGENTFCNTINIVNNYETPAAAFEFSGDPIVTFTDLSSNIPDNWYWNFGDGNFSTEQNPVHNFTSNGSFNVCLTASNVAGENTFCSIINIVNNYETPVALFEFSGDPAVSFTDISTNNPTEWFWDFGGEGTSTLANPTFTFLENGEYDVCLTASNPAGFNVNCQTVAITNYAEPVADFTYVNQPLVEFYDASSGTPTSWYWEFDDGTFSLLQNPTHLFLENDTYNVCLTAHNIHGSNTICKDIIIDSYTAPVADFIFSGDPSVTFTDNSLNEPDSWYWIFGDGGISTEQNPTHLFTENDIYNVCLFVTNDIGTDVICQNVVIEGYTISPTAAFSTSGDPIVEFIDESLNSPSMWYWEFGDGFTSTLQNPIHEYISNGTYDVCLTATNIVGSDTHCEVVVVDTYMPPSAEFAYSGDPVVTFTDLSTYSPNTWFWSFDDGTYSTEQNPIHNFVSNGTYNVCLTATGAGGTNTWCTEINIITNGVAPSVDFNYSSDKNTILFTDDSEGMPTSWFWDFGDGSFSAIQNPVHTYAAATTYYVCLTASNTYGENTVCKTIDFLSIDNGLKSAIQIFPNPSTHFIQFELPTSPEAITLINAEGQQIKIDYTTLSNNNYYVNTTTLTAGVYTIMVQYENETQSVRFVKL
jgi:PKD repeat protein